MLPLVLVGCFIEFRKTDDIVGIFRRHVGIDRERWVLKGFVEVLGLAEEVLP